MIRDMKPPYYAVIFTSQRTAKIDGYDDTADRMMELAAAQPGYLGVESARDAGGLGITVSYWATLEDIAAWRAHATSGATRSPRTAAWEPPRRHRR